MPRMNRKWHPGAKYHIMCRGNRKAKVFNSEEDYHAYISILKFAKRKHNFYLYAFCLMPNHIHLQLETTDVSISKIMHTINMRYAMYLNRTYDLVGHTFQGRYKSIIGHTDSYMLMVNRYIHRNPVEAMMVFDPSVYPYSSYRAYLNRRSNSMVDWARFMETMPVTYEDIVDI